MATTDDILILVAAVLTCAGIIALRKKRLWIRFAFEFWSLAALSALLRWHGAYPVLGATTAGVAGASFWLRILATVWWVAAARILSSLVTAVLGHDERSREARLLSDLLGAGIYLLAGLCILNFILELPVKGLLATSGVVAVVIGLALQNTLADVFSGIAVGVEAPFSVGDRISLGDNIEGTVVQINWRSTRVRTDGDDVAIIPNSRVARLDIINRSVPTMRRTARVEVQCPALAPPEAVIELLTQAALLCPRVLNDPPVTASLIRLGVQRNMFAVDFSVSRTSELGAAKTQLLLAIRRQLHRSGHLHRATDPGATADAHQSEILRQTGLFSGIDPEQLTQLAARLEAITLAKGELLFTQGELDPTLYILASGVIELSLAEEPGRSVSLGRLGLGDFVGEVCLLTGVPHPASATALTRCEVHRLSKSAIEPLMQANPELIPRLERAVRSALEQIHRGASAQVGIRAAGSGPLLERIYGFFHHAPPAQGPAR